MQKHLVVPCKECGQEAGKPCLDSNGKPRAPHAVRKKAQRDSLKFQKKERVLDDGD